jgi:hypothetical protein
MNPILIAEIISILTQAATLLPTLEQIIPVIEAAINGQTLTNDQLVSLISARQALEAKVKAGAPVAAA